MAFPLSSQQPIARTVGRRVPAPPGAPQSAEERAAWNAMAAYRTRVPKGVYSYYSHDEMIRDRDNWVAAGVAARR